MTRTQGLALGFFFGSLSVPYFLSSAFVSWVQHPFFFSFGSIGV
jgi:hypothetical protein